MSYVRDVITETCRKLNQENFTYLIHYQFSNRFTARLGDARYYFNEDRGVVRFSLPLWGRATEQERYETIVHEVCHIIAYRMHGRKIKAHGNEWKCLMETCGVKPERCHTVDRTGLRRKVQRYNVYCKCGAIEITKHLRTKMMKGKYYSCKKCKALVSVNPNVYATAANQSS